MASTVSHQCLAEEIENRTLLLAAGFDHRQNTFDKAAAMIGLRAMRSAPPDHRVTQGAFGAVVGWFETGDGDEAPEVRIGSQEQTTRGRGMQRGGGQSQREQCRI